MNAPATVSPIFTTETRVTAEGTALRVSLAKAIEREGQASAKARLAAWAVVDAVRAETIAADEAADIMGVLIAPTVKGKSLDEYRRRIGFAVAGWGAAGESRENQ